jgi:hypothetical protein
VTVNPDNDTKNNCFVCGNTRQDFSKLGRNFDIHIESEHDPWKYIYYIYYLQKKGESNLSGVEYHAWTLFSQKKTNWIPIGNTLYIQSDTIEQLKGLDDRIQALSTGTQKLTGYLVDLKKHTEEILVATGLKEKQKAGGESPARQNHSPK